MLQEHLGRPLSAIIEDIEEGKTAREELVQAG